MIVSPFLNSRSARVTPWRSYASGRDSQAPSSAFTEGPSQMETVTCSGRGVRKAEERCAAGRRIGPEAVTELVRNGTGRHASRTMQLSASWRCHSPANQINTSRRLTSGTKSRISHPVSRVFRFGVVTLKSAQQGRDSVCFTVPKKALHRRCLRFAFPSVQSALEFMPPPWRKPGRFPPSRSTGPRGCIHSR